MTRRYYVPDLVEQCQSRATDVVLPEPERAHAVQVMRVRPGDGVQLFDGQNRQIDAIVVDASRRHCHCRVASPGDLMQVDREASQHLELAIALPKPDRARELMSRLTELGVARVHPIVCEHTQRAPTPSALQKLRTAIIEACKQSGRNRLMDVAPVQNLTEFLSSSGASCSDASRWIATPTVPTREQEPSPGQPAVTTPAVVLIGPEGGFSDHELNLALRAGWKPLILGKRILRIETAAVTVAARMLVD